MLYCVAIFMARSNSVAGRVLQLMPDQFEVQGGSYFKPFSADNGKAITKYSGADINWGSM
jgi:hypothetical protein